MHYMMCVCVPVCVQSQPLHRECPRLQCVAVIAATTRSQRLPATGRTRSKQDA